MKILICITEINYIKKKITNRLNDSVCVCVCVYIYIYIYRQFVVLHTCTDIISYTTVVRCKKSSDAPITKDNSLLNLFWCVCCKRKHFCRSFLSSPLVLSCLNTAVGGFLSGSGSRYAIKFLIWGCITSILAPNITTRWYFKLLMKLNLCWFVLLPA